MHDGFSDITYLQNERTSKMPSICAVNMMIFLFSASIAQGRSVLVIKNQILVAVKIRRSSAESDDNQSNAISRLT